MGLSQKWMQIFTSCFSNSIFSLKSDFQTHGFLKKKKEKERKANRMHVWAGKSACLVAPNAEFSTRKFQPAISEFNNSSHSGWGSSYILFRHSYNKTYVLNCF